MPLFGSKSKIKFNSDLPPDEDTRDLYQHPERYSFVHNFKVHYKRGVLQAIANKMDVSISSVSPKLPTMQEVTAEFNNKMTMSLAHTNTRMRYSQASFHITNIEYKESIAMFLNVPQTPISQQVSSDSIYCRSCGAKLPPDSKFCNKCGTPISS
jgi:ribosomal protein L40E